MYFVDYSYRFLESDVETFSLITFKHIDIQTRENCKNKNNDGGIILREMVHLCKIAKLHCYHHIRYNRAFHVKYT